MVGAPQGGGVDPTEGEGWILGNDANGLSVGVGLGAGVEGREVGAQSVDEGLVGVAVGEAELVGVCGKEELLLGLVGSSIGQYSY